MKNIIKISSLLIAIFAVNLAFGQSVKSYELIMPANVIDGGGKVYVKSLTTTGEYEKGFGDAMASAIKSKLNSERRGQAKGVKCFNPWYTTKIYEVVEDESSADVIVSGNYVFTGSATNKETQHDAVEKRESGIKIPFTYFEYVSSASASVGGKLVVTKGSTVVEHPISDRKSKSKTDYLKRPYVSSPASFMSGMTKAQIKTKSGLYSPYFKENNYRFKNIKTKDKLLKKEFKAKGKTIKASLKTNDLIPAAKTFLEIHETEKSLNSAYNVGMCYELIGNFTKAKEYYDMAGDKGALKNLQKLLAVKAQFENLGLEVVENEL